MYMCVSVHEDKCNALNDILKKVTMYYHQEQFVHRVIALGCMEIV